MGELNFEKVSEISEPRFEGHTTICVIFRIVYGNHRSVSGTADVNFTLEVYCNINFNVTISFYKDD